MPESLIPSLDQIVAFFAVTWSGWLVAVLIIVGGQISKGIARARGWRGPNSVYDLTLRAHPIVVGFLFGFIAFPTFEAIDTLEPRTSLVLVRCCYFAGWGCISGQLFELGKFGKKWARAYVEMKTGVRVTTSPSEPPPSGEKTTPETPRAKRAAEDVDAEHEGEGES